MTLLGAFENVSILEGPSRTNMCDHLCRQVLFTGMLDGLAYT